MPVVTHKVTREDRVNAVWKAFKRSVEDNTTADIIFPMLYRRAVRGGFVHESQFTLIKWHCFLRPWLYPDPNPFPFFDLRRRS